MNHLIKQIREAAQMSQTGFAEKLGVSFATVNRWENGRAVPNKIAQFKIYELAKAENVAMADLIYQRIRKESEMIALTGNRVLLYHGSKSGLKGKIAPISRQHCDFGKGFYMGTIPKQPLTLICDFEESRFYIVSVDMQGLQEVKVAPDLDWAMLVAYHRGKMESIKGTAFYRRYASLAENADVVTGCIANDRMFFVLDSFFQGTITDKALISSLSALKLGEQYVAVTQKACEQVRIEKEIKLSYMERKCLQEVSETNRTKGVSMANDICRKHRREGVFFDEILDAAREE